MQIRTLLFHQQILTKIFNASPGGNGGGGTCGLNDKKRHLGVLSHKHEPSIQNNLGIRILLYYTLYLWKELPTFELFSACGSIESRYHVEGVVWTFDNFFITYCNLEVNCDHTISHDT